MELSFLFKSTHGGETKKRRWAEFVKFLYMPEMGLLGRPGSRTLVELGKICQNFQFPQFFSKTLYVLKKNAEMDRFDILYQVPKKPKIFMAVSIRLALKVFTIRLF